MSDAPFFVALDVGDSERAEELAATLRPVTRRFKIGLELWSLGGPDLVRRFVEAGDEIFLDLKLHDIPRQVERAVTALAGLGVRWTTVHASGGRGMLEAARKATEDASGPRLLGVTVLTSLDGSDLAEIGVERGVAEQVAGLARLATGCGIDALVCSPADASDLREVLGPEPTLVCPGVRPAGADAGDQKRIATPEAAMEAGASLLVIGRPITRSLDPLEAARRIAAALGDGAAREAT